MMFHDDELNRNKIFERLKIAFVSESILALFDFDCETILKADLSRYITGDVLF